MQNYYLRIEAVNLANFIEDTEQLSIIRGGGLLLLRAMNKLENNFEWEGELNAISTGASSGLFSFKAKSLEDAYLLRDQVEQFFRDHDVYKYATFVVDCEPSFENNFRKCLEKVTARNRWRQYQQPTLITPVWNKDSTINESEFSDRLRPAPANIKMVKDDTGVIWKGVSLDAKIRYDYGRDQKQMFYRDEVEKYCGAIINDRFTNDLEELTKGAPVDVLSHKMAVIYADGNSFGKLQRKYCHDETSQRNFDTYLKNKRAAFLKDLLDLARDNHLFTTKKQAGQGGEDKRVLQIETLMWGGDELLLVVPAWQGWAALSLLYRHVKNWEFSDQLYHGAGIVFCHHNAPIHRITRLAKELAEEAKNRDRKKNLFQYCVLESFDYIGRELSRFRKEQFPGTLAETPFSLSGGEMADIIKPFSRLKEQFPKRKAYSLVRAAILDGQEGGTRHYQREIERVKQVVEKPAKEAATALAETGFFGSIEENGWPPGMWLHIVELWDFIDSTYGLGGIE